MPKQKITIDFTTGSCSQEFRILHVWKTEKQLIVASKLHSASAFGLASLGRAHDEVDVEVAHELPVKHYAIGIGEHYLPEFLGDYKPISIKRETGIPEVERANCLYECVETDSKEQIGTAIFRARDYGQCQILSYAGSSEIQTKLYHLVKDQGVVTSLLQKGIYRHNHDQQVMMMSLATSLNTVLDMEKDGELTHDEAACALQAFHLSHDDAKKLNTAVSVNKPGLDAAKRQGRRVTNLHHDEIAQTHQADESVSNGLTRWGLFAGASALAVGYCLLQNNLEGGFKP